MNTERYMEHAIQSGWGQGKDHDDCMECSRFNVKEFAYLIVKDCIDIVDKHQAYEVMDDIIDHFGVEP